MSVSEEIWQRWSEAVVHPALVDGLTALAERILHNKPRYELVGHVVNIPYYVIGCIHLRESSFNFSTHLANGDPLWNSDGNPIATTHVPKGLGPFDSWEEAAIGALEHEGFQMGYHWDLVNALDNLERYNGLGYRHLGLPSPYIWAMTDEYKSGKYRFDGKYDPDLVDKQPGCAAIFFALKSLGVDLQEIPCK